MLAHPNTKTLRWPLAYRFAALWLVFVSWSSCSGWVLSALGQLNRTGYAISLIPLIVISVALWKGTSAGQGLAVRFGSSFRTSGPGAWALVVILSFIAGLLFAPSNYDALSYRLPRILYWWQENRWHWLEHADQRMNYSGTGFEWQMLPLIVFSGSDRLLFLLNWLPFLFFPALVFGCLTTSGVKSRIAAHCMWILPLAFGYALQASSIGNDAMGAVFVVAAIAFCGQAVTQQSPLALALAAVAASALTGLKLSNLPLLLPIGLFWIGAAWKIKHRLRELKILAASVPVAAALLLTGFLPYAWMNHANCGNWSGDPEDKDGLRITRTLPGLTGNLFNLTTGTFQLPVLPLSASAKHRILEPLSGENSLSSYIQKGFSRFKPHVGGEIPIEEGAGIGLGVALSLGIPLAVRPRVRRKLPACWLPLASTWVAVFAYMASLGSENTARLMLPYYPLMIASVLTAISWRSGSKRIIRACVWIPFLFLLPGLLLNPNRPLLPITALAKLPGLPQSLHARIAGLTEAYDFRSDPLHAIRDDLPPECKVIGFAGGPTESAYSLFKPFGNRKIIEVHQDNSQTFEWLVAAPAGIQERVGQPWEKWLSQSHYSVEEHYRIAFTARVGPQDWYLLRANDNPATRE